MWLHSGRIDRNGRVSGGSVNLTAMVLGGPFVVLLALGLAVTHPGWVFGILAAMVAVTVLGRRSAVRKTKRDQEREYAELLAKVSDPERYLRQQRSQAVNGSATASRR